MFSADQPTISSDGSPRHQCSTAPALTRNGDRISIGSREAISTQERATTENATLSAAQGETTTAASAAISTLRRASQRSDGRGTSFGHDRATRPAESSPRSTVTTTSSATKPGIELW